MVVWGHSKGYIQGPVQNPFDPIEDISEEAMNTILFGSEEVFKIKEQTDGASSTYSIAFEGIANFISKQNDEQSSPTTEKWVQSFMNKITCTKCAGARLKKESLFFKIDGKEKFVILDNIKELPMLAYPSAKPRNN